VRWQKKTALLFFSQTLYAEAKKIKELFARWPFSCSLRDIVYTS